MNIKKLGLSFVKNYLRLLVGLLFRAKKPEIIAVTGTAGKTTTKETIYAVLHQKFGDQVGRTYGSLSTKTGIPIGLLAFTPNWTNLGPAWWQWPFWLFWATARALVFLVGIRSYPRVFVVEFAADLPGDFDFLLSYIHPSIAVVTNLGAGHLQFFGSASLIAREKGKIVQALPADGYAILNYNDELVRAMAKRTKAKVLWVRAKGLSFAPAAARIIGRLYNMGYPEIERGLTKVKLPAGRMDILKGRQGIVIIDSTYNANPISMAAALEVLANYPRKSIRESRKIAILGQMLELGAQSQIAHKKLYQQARLVADSVITVGKGFNKLSHQHFDRVDQAIESILSFVKPGDIILVKGSHGVGLKKLVEALTK